MAVVASHEHMQPARPALQVGHRARRCCVSRVLVQRRVCRCAVVRPKPLRSVAPIFVQVAIGTGDEHVDAPHAVHFICDGAREGTWVGNRTGWRSLVSPLPSGTVPVVVGEMTGRVGHEHVKALGTVLGPGDWRRHNDHLANSATRDQTRERQHKQKCAGERRRVACSRLAGAAGVVSVAGLGTTCFGCP